MEATSTSRIVTAFLGMKLMAVRNVGFLGSTADDLIKRLVLSNPEVALCESLLHYEAWHVARHL